MVMLISMIVYIRYALFIFSLVLKIDKDGYTVMDCVWCLIAPAKTVHETRICQSLGVRLILRRVNWFQAHFKVSVMNTHCLVKINWKDLKSYQWALLVYENTQKGKTFPGKLRVRCLWRCWVVCVALAYHHHSTPMFFLHYLNPFSPLYQHTNLLPYHQVNR